MMLHDLGDIVVIRIRRVKAFPPWRRRYEVDIDGEVRRTGTPATSLEGEVGVGDAWSLVHAADDAWEADQPGWISFPRQVKATGVILARDVA